MTEAAPPQPSAEDRIRRNREFLSARFPDLAQLLAAATAAIPVRDDVVLIDLDIGQSPLYGSDGRTLATDQVVGYIQKPLRFGLINLAGRVIQHGRRLVPPPVFLDTKLTIISYHKES